MLFCFPNRYITLAEKSLFMKTLIALIISFFISINCFSQNLTSQQLLDKAISYHDPNGVWSTFFGILNITMETPNNTIRDSEIEIDLPKEYFNLITIRDTTTITYTINKADCIISENDSLRIAKDTTKPKRSHCDKAKLFKNYYTYLYGLPMKLKDPGTIVSNTVNKKRFKGKDYLTLKVNYEATVGNDIWYFYFNPNTYAMEIYQFYKTDENGKIKPNSGEYILLNDEVIINTIKMPKIRAWHYNKDDKHLGTDILRL